METLDIPMLLLAVLSIGWLAAIVWGAVVANRNEDGGAGLALAIFGGWAWPLALVFVAVAYLLAALVFRQAPVRLP